MPCKLPFSFCSVRHGAVKGYLNKRLCPLLPAVTKTMLTGSQRSIHHQLGFNSRRPPWSIFPITVSCTSSTPSNQSWQRHSSSQRRTSTTNLKAVQNCRNLYLGTLQESYLKYLLSFFQPLFGKWARAPPSNSGGNRAYSLPRQGESFERILSLSTLSFIYPFYLFIYLLDLNFSSRWSCDQLSVNKNSSLFEKIVNSQRPQRLPKIRRISYWKHNSYHPVTLKWLSIQTLVKLKKKTNCRKIFPYALWGSFPFYS